MDRFLVFLIAGLLFLCSCKSNKILISKKEIKTISPLCLIDSIKVAYGDFESYHGKFKIYIKSGNKKNSLAGSLKVKRDSLMWISINPGLGIEVARALFSLDSLMFLERVNSTYFKGCYESLNALFGVEADYYTLQSIFLNTLYFYNYSDNLELMKNVRVRKDKNGKNIELENFTRRIARKNETNSESPIVYQKVTVDNSNLKVKEIFIKDFKENQVLSIQYSDFMYVDSIKAEFPQVIKLKINSRKHDIEADVRFSKQTFNIQSEYNFSVPSSYKLLPLNLKTTDEK